METACVDEVSLLDGGVAGGKQTLSGASRATLCRLILLEGGAVLPFIPDAERLIRRRRERTERDEIEAGAVGADVRGEERGFGDDVVVEKHDELRLRLLDPTIARGGEAGVALLDHAQAIGQIGRKLVTHVYRAIGTAGADHQELETFGGNPLAGERQEGALERVAPVMRWDDDAGL